MFSVALLLFSSLASADPIERSWSLAGVAEVFTDCYFTKALPSREVGPLAESLGDLQDKMISDLAKSGHLKPLLKVSSDMSFISGIANISLIVGDGNELLGMAYSVTKYPMEVIRGTQRIFPLSLVNEKGVVLGDLQGTEVGRLTGDHLNKNGGKVVINYLADFKNGIKGQGKFQVEKDAAGNWRVVDVPSGKKVNEVHLITWIHLFPLNFGIERAELK